MIVLKECVGKRKSHQNTVSPGLDKARLVGADGKIASFLIKECLGTEMKISRRRSVGSWSSDLFSRHLSPFIIVSAHRRFGQCCPELASPFVSFQIAFLLVVFRTCGMSLGASPSSCLLCRSPSFS